MSRTRYPNKLITALAVLAAAGLGVGSAGAQEDSFEPGTQLLSGFLGPSFDLGGEGEDVEGQEGIEFESEWHLGGSYQYFFTPKLSLEATAAFVSGEGEIEGPGEDDGEDSDDEESDDENGEEEEDGEEEIGGNAVHITGALLYHFRPQGRLRPYVTGGGGLVRVDVDGTTDTRPAGVFGGGLLIGLSPSVRVRVDVRDTLYTLDSGGDSTTRSDLSLTGGLSFRF
ncbi:MAG TPA: outer membrane beta-barrel protein [Vicinamibacteria bacterium]|jgi:opacity protein-like surface antigen